MNTSQGENINQRVFDKLDDIDLRKKTKQVEKLYPEAVKRAFPKDKILNAGEAVTHLQKETKLDESIVRNCK